MSSDESLRCQVTATDTLVQVVLLAGISVDTYVISHFSPFLSISSRLVSKFLPTSKRKKQEKIGPGKNKDKLWQGPELATNELANHRCSELGADSKKYG